MSQSKQLTEDEIVQLIHNYMNDHNWDWEANLPSYPMRLNRKEFTDYVLEILRLVRSPADGQNKEDVH
jgi:hypothetical protein